MTGTPSRTTTAYGGGTTRHPVVAGAFLHEPPTMPRGYVGRKLKAKLRSEEHESHMRRAHDGRGPPAFQSPEVIRISERKCGGYMERRSRALPREICLSARGIGRETRYRASRRRCPGRPVEHAPGAERIACHTEIQSRAGEALRSTMDRQKSADSTSCLRTAT
jgi:hypothetical protein